MSANSVLPPLDVTLRALSSEYLAGTTLNELSECHSRLPMEKSRRRSSRANGLWSLSRLDTSANVVGRRYSWAARNPVPIASSSSPRLCEKVSCWASSMNWSRNTSTACVFMPSWIAATSAPVRGLPMLMPETSAARQGPTWRKLTGMTGLSRDEFASHSRAAPSARRVRPAARLPGNVAAGKLRMSARRLLRDGHHVVHAVAGAAEEFFDIARRLADAVLVLHQRNAHKTFAIF